MSVLTGIPGEAERNDYISVYSIPSQEREGSSGKSDRVSEPLFLLSAHICKYNASYARSRAGLPPTAPLSRALIVILA